MAGKEKNEELKENGTDLFGNNESKETKVKPKESKDEIKPKETTPEVEAPEVTPAEEAKDVKVSDIEGFEDIKTIEDFKVAVQAIVSEKVEEKNKSLEAKTYDYSNLGIQDAYHERVKNNDRVSSFYFSPHFAKIRGAYTKISFNLTPYIFSTEQTTMILDEHMPLVIDWIEEAHYPHGDEIKNDPSMLAGLEAYSKSVNV